MTATDIYQYLAEQQLSPAITAIEQLLRAMPLIDIDTRDRFVECRELHTAMMHYLDSPTPDPALQHNWHYLIRTLYEVTDTIYAREVQTQDSHLAERSRLSELMLSGGLESIASALLPGEKLLEGNRVRYDELVDRLAQGLLYTNLWSEELGRTLEQCDAYVRQVSVSALTLSLLRGWHTARLKWLIDQAAHYISMGRYDSVRVRIIVGLTLVGIRYDKRVELYQSILGYDSLLDQDLLPAEEIQTVWTGLLKITYTPQVRGYVEQLMQRFNNPTFLQGMQDAVAKHFNEDASGGYNTDYDPDKMEALEEFLPMVENMQEASREIQRLLNQGYDVHYAMAEQMLQGIFFQEEVHWLLPFDLRHSYLYGFLHQLYERFNLDEGHIVAMYQQALPQQADLDRYGFTLRLHHTPDVLLQSIAHELRSRENVVNQHSYTPPQEESELTREEYLRLLSFYPFQLYRYFTLGRKSRQGYSPFDRLPPIHIPLLASQTEALRPTLTHMLSEHYRRQGDYEAQVALLQVQLQEIDQEHTDYAKLSYRLARLLVEQKKLVEAYTTLLPLSPQALPDHRIALLQAHILQEMHHPSAAISLLEPLLAEAPKELSLVEPMAFLLIDQGEYHRALLLLLQCEFEGSCAEALYPAIAWVLTLLKRSDDAEEYYQRTYTAVEDLPRDFWITEYTRYYALRHGHLALAQGQVATALARYRQSIKTIGAEAHRSRWIKDLPALRGIGVPQHLIKIVQDWHSDKQ